MIRSFTRWAALTCTTAALAIGIAVLPPTPAQGATVQIPAAVVIPVQVIGADSFCTGGFVAGGTASAPTLTCVTGAGPGPLACSILGAPSGTVAANSSVSLTMSCSGGTSPYTYSWSPTGATSANLATTVAATTTFIATATDSVLATNQKSATVTVGSGGGGGGGFSGSCPGVNHTAYLIESWANPVKIYTANAGGFNINDVAVIQFTTGSLSVDGRTGGISGVEFGSATSMRFMTLSTQPCDFTSGNVLKSNTSTAPQISFSVGTNSIGAPQLSINTTYYVNVMNVAPASCAVTGICDMDFQMAKPRGL
jgi:hypothetical protein